MKKRIPGAIVLLIILYLALFPVPIEPVAWQAPIDGGFVAHFAANDRLARARTFSIAPYTGPEDITSGVDGQLYATTHEGVILRLDGRGGVDVFADVGGRPLGIELDSDGSLLVANAYKGIQRVSHEGNVSTVVDEVDGLALVYADDLAIGLDGVIYFSEASTKFGAQMSGGTYEASLLDINEHGGHGFVVAFDPRDASTRVLLDGLNFANGVAISDDQSFLLIAETGAYRILKHWLTGPRAGETEVILDNLPAFPDNINTGNDGRFWIGFVSPRSAALDALSDKPLLRKVVQRLPAFMRPQAQPHSQVIAINGDGEVLLNLQDAQARFPALTGVFETPSALYFTALFGGQIAYIDKSRL
ncbi:MAG: SMP-30/gluconolactonase/LRE family protein [Pseudomonadota bacterium]